MRSAGADLAIELIGSARTLPQALQPLRDAADGFRFLGAGKLERYLPFSEIYDEALRRAALLGVRGFASGDRVALIVTDEAEMVLSFLGIVLAGLVPVLIAPRHVQQASNGVSGSIEHILQSSGARLILVSATMREALTSAIGPGGGARNVEPIEDIFAADACADIDRRLPTVDPDRPCFLQYTSGSTGRPKGTIVTHRNVLANVKAGMSASLGGKGSRESVVSWLPLYHDFGLIAFFLSPLLARVPATIISPSLFARRPKVWLEMLHERRATITGAPNFAFGFLMRRLKPADLEGLDLSGLRVMFCGGEPIQRNAFLAFADGLAPAGFDRRCFMPSYGLAESTAVVTTHPYGQPLISDVIDVDALRDGRAALADAGQPARTIVSCGYPIADHHIAITDEDGAALPEGQVGLIRVKGPSVSPGYFGDDATTRETWRDGWLDTGDLGYLREGQLFVCGRVKDLIIVRGVNYHPQEIEWTVEPLIEGRGRRVAAFPTVQDGSESFAVVIEAPLVGEERETLVAAASEAVVREHGIVPSAVEVVPLGAIPLTTSGKIQRRRLREMYEADAFSNAKTTLRERALA